MSDLARKPERDERYESMERRIKDLEARHAIILERLAEAEERLSLIPCLPGEECPVTVHGEQHA